MRPHHPTFAAFAAALSIAAAGPAAAALVAAYDFNETGGPTAHASAGGVNGTLVGGASFAAGAGIQGGALSLSSARDGFVDLGANLFPSGAFSVQVWVNTTDTGPIIPVGYHTGGIVGGYWIGIGDVRDGCNVAPGKASFGMRGAPWCSGGSSVTVSDGQWHQLVGTYDGWQSSIFVDGQLQSRSPGGNALFTPVATTHFLIGGIMNGATPVSTYVGLIDSVRLYDTALTASEVGVLYATAAVPEPQGAALLAGGLLVLGLLRSRSGRGA